MKTVLKIFFGAEGTRPFLVLFCLLLAGIAEIFGMGSLLPLASNLAGGTTEHSSPLNRVILDFLESVGFPTSLGNLISLISAMLALRAILSFTALSYAGIAAAKVAINLRRRLIAAVFDARWSFYTSQSSGKFANALSVDATRSGEAYLLAAQVISKATQVAVYALVSMFIDWRLASLALAAGIVLLIFFSRLVRAARRAGAHQNKQMQRLAILVVDLLSSIKPLKSMSRYQTLVDSMGVMLKEMRRAMVVRELSIQGVTQGGDLLIALLVGGGVFAASKFWNTPLPELVVSGVVFYQIVASTSRLQRLLQTAAGVENSYTRLAAMIDNAKASREEQQGKLKPEIGDGCRFDNVTFCHGKKPVVSGISLEIPANQITVLQGPSGAGKTTLIDLLIGLHRPDSGSILIGSNPIEEIDTTRWRKMIGYVPQELNLLHTTIRDNIALGETTISDDRIVETMKLVGAADIIESRPRGLDSSVGEMGGKLSGGQRQRISLARALVVNPALLILDEVTSAVDPETEKAIVANIAALKGQYTIVAITHRPAWTEIADRLYQIKAGSSRLIEPQKAKPAAARKRRAKRTGSRR